VHAAIEAGGEPLTLLRRCVESLVPSYADGCEVDVLVDGEVVRIVAGTNRQDVRQRERLAVADVPDHPVLAVLAGAPARLIDIDVPGDEHLLGPPDVPGSARSLGIRTALLAPVVAAGEVIGSLGLGRGPSGRRFGADDVATAVDLARRIGLGWHNAVLLSERAGLLASLHDGLVVIDRDGVVVEVNDRWTELTGFTRAESVGAASPYPWAPDEPVRSPRAVPGPLERRVVLRRADGSRMPALVSVAPLVGRAAGDRRALVASVKDLTAWEEVEADLLSLQQVTARLAAAHDVADVVDATIGAALERTDAGAGFLLRLADDGQHVELVGSDGPLAEKIPDAGPFRIENTVPSNVAIRDRRTVRAGSAAELAELYPDMVPVARDLGVASALSTPILHHGDVVGALALWSTVPDAFDAADVRFLEAVAGQASQALVRAEGYEVEHRASQALQRRLLSDVPVLHDRATIVTRYQPAVGGMTVGGDWYDVVRLGPARLAVVVGDVVGSGVDAAAVMGQLRSALKGIALVSPEPAAVLSGLDRLARVTAGAMGATVCYVVVDLEAGNLRFARAGHPPPLVAGADGGARFVDGRADPPLGMGSGERHETTEPFATGDVLLLYTDGLVERRDAGLDERLELLRATAATATRASVDLLVEEVLDACVGSATLRDDLAVLALRDEPAGPERYRALVPASARELSPLRRSFRAWLVGAGLDDEAIDDVLLATSEAATNAVEHAYRDVVGDRPLVGVAAVATDDGVRVEVRDAGRWKARPSQTTRGRGLAIARALLGDVEVRTGPSGTTVSFSSGRTRAR
jgi:PAS domain S-box-containing protein